MSTVSLKLLSSSHLISQGAEAKVYKGSLTTDGTPVLFKHRFKKQYRHTTLDTTLTKARVAGEARALMKCLRSGVNVPGVRMVDAAEGLLGIEWIEGKSVKWLIPSGAQDDDDEEQQDEISLDEFQLTIDQLMRLIGIEIAKMHLADIIHGDLTTSNMMVRRQGSKSDLVLIDFGLSYHSSLVEDKAVDLYVLERAFASTHPDSEPMFASVLSAYATQLGKDWPALRRRLDDVRLRGRKRSMVG
ncbi:EKC/KEOPS complex subunit BUD32 [Psilocybe cubensis]|uniref:EKC/KEOPS complex subunit BUD32 n=2 Tax=Psilocybe cubensis TaxID=181762 RepID=A0ACB8GHQ7_PSICU|nr:EKC/KEOPS complex subunit BUD32 [Psilocybe cubensis]KAH9475036.1 EKC/KEOPS complex subunit BUD32 [Psilocybe cubensis]